VVHQSHAGFGTDPSSRAPSAQDHLDPLARVLGADAAAARAQLRGGAHALRQALILNEILGPPAAERDDRY
jgi:cystathionine beta-lyase family protein involved in aluminum resistance